MTAAQNASAAGQPGTVIRLSERGQDDDGAFLVRVSFGDDAEYDVRVADPADEADEEGLAWYFEQHLRYPFLDQDRERLAVRHIAAYGEALFSQVFGGPANHDYRTMRDRSFDGCRLEVSGSAALQRLHWEALRDPDLNTPLSVRLPITRRVAVQPSRFALSGDRPTLNILLVTARPDGPRDIGYRTISRPLLKALRTAGVPITVDLVRPGTWQGLRAHLFSVSARQGTGWYHVVHFDLHGTFSDFVELEKGRQTGRLCFSPGPRHPFEGRRGFLFFEAERDAVAEPVAAEKVASLLAEHRVPVAVLNACQSAMQSASEASLAQRLAEAGVPITVGMAYSVTVSAAKLAMPVLYRDLADGADPTRAVHAARRELYERQTRQAYFAQQINLEDWMLPVMFAQRQLHVQLRPMTGDEQRNFYERQAVVGDEPETEFGFVGRDLDIHAIERRLLANPDSNELLVQGMAGAGKSTLLAHLGWWWKRTGLVEQVFYFSYQDRAWTSSQIVHEIRSRLSMPPKPAHARERQEVAETEQVADWLRTRRHLLILDNAESITAAPAAIPHALNLHEQQKLKTLISRLSGGRTLVLLGSREPEAWLTSHSTGPDNYALPGLDPQAASELVEHILHRHGGEQYLRDEAERGALEDMVTLLGGYPLPLTVVLPRLATSAPSAVLAELKTGGPGADPSGLIHRAIELSHGKLDPALQNSLLLLAPFTSVIDTGMILERYQGLLLDNHAVRELGHVDLAAALHQAVGVGLAFPDPQLRHLVKVQPVLPYFLRSRLRDRPALRAAVEQAHFNTYRELGATLHGLLTSVKAPHDRAIGLAVTRAEYANLAAAISYGLHTGESINAVFTPLLEFLDQTQQYDTSRQLVDDAIRAFPEDVTSAHRRELADLHGWAGSVAVAQVRLDDARAHYDIELALREADADPRSLGTVYHQLGIVAQEQRRFQDAEASYRRALDIRLDLQDLDGVGDTYHQLGMVALIQRRYQEAEGHFRSSLGIFLKSGNPDGAAAVYHSLARLALEQRCYQDAEANYRRALDIGLEFQDLDGVAKIYHHLGALHQEQGDYQGAEDYYRDALSIFLDLGNRANAARTYHHLGMAAEGQRRYEEAEANYRRALDIKLEFGDLHGAATTYYQLGILYQLQARYREAEDSYREAISTRLEFDDEHSVATTYHQLGTLYHMQGRYQEAEDNYSDALDILLRFGDQFNAAKTCRGLGILLAQSGRHGEAARVLLIAAMTWRRETGYWSRQNLEWLRREYALIEQGELTALVAATIPPDLVDELATAVEEAGDPDEQWWLTT